MSPRQRLSGLRRLLAATVAVGFIVVAAQVEAWNVRCFHEPDDADCTDPYDDVQTPWRADPQAEHRAILDRTLEISGLPAAFREPFELTLFASGETLTANITKDDVVQTFTHQSIRPVRLGARERRTREVSIPAMASLPDFSYTLWDWASGNELCPPAPGGEPVDCHNYETHIGWLNSNHMLPQARRFYDYLHELALEKADACKDLYDGLSPTDREDRFSGFLLACEQMALAIEGVAHHYLQDAWALGHMWERWGGPEPADFGGNRTLGFAVAGFVGSIHGSKAVLDADPLTAILAPWDDPMNAPHFDAQYIDAANGALRLGVGDVFLEDWIFSPPPFLFLPPSLDPQRHAMLGCAVDGIRDVYERTAQFHGPLAPAATAEFDGSRDVDDDACWGQRATNRALGLGCGIHNGTAPGQSRLLGGGLTSIIFWALADAEARGLPPLGPALTFAFQRDAAYACTLAMAAGAVPVLAEQTNLAAGGLPSIAGVLPNSAYARGGAGTAPTSYADPALPWNVDASDPALREREEALNLTFADAHAAERCHDYSEADLLEFRAQVAIAQQQGDPVVIDARCGQCLQQVAPHLRRGRPGDHDIRREAFCGLVGPPDAAFIYTNEDPATFTDTESIDFPALALATRQWCGCTDIRVSVQPLAATLPPGGTQAFTATVLGATNVDVTWTATGGTITPTGLYTAGSTAGVFSATATSVEDPTQSASAVVTIASPGPAFGGTTGGLIVQAANPGISRGCNTFATSCNIPTFSQTGTIPADTSGAFGSCPAERTQSAQAQQSYRWTFGADGTTVASIAMTAETSAEVSPAASTPDGAINCRDGTGSAVAISRFTFGVSNESVGYHLTGRLVTAEMADAEATYVLSSPQLGAIVFDAAPRFPGGEKLVDVQGTLTPGEYTLQVHIRIAAGRLSNEDAERFSIGSYNLTLSFD